MKLNVAPGMSPGGAGNEPRRNRSRAAAPNSGNPALWPLVFMAATLGGMMRAPVMSVMFALEQPANVEVNEILVRPTEQVR